MNEIIFASAVVCWCLLGLFAIGLPAIGGVLLGINAFMFGVVCLAVFWWFRSAQEDLKG